MDMKIVIAGGTGFVGTELTKLLQKEGHEVVILTRHQKANTTVQYVEWLTANSKPEKHIGDADVFINLAGVSINDGRWTKKHQQAIYTSRMEATDALLQLMTSLPKKNRTLINASAIGLYPASLHAIYTEESTKVADDFLAKTVFDWERKATQAKTEHTRVVCTRFGVILGEKEGALPLIAMPYKLYAGGPVGSGEQWLSWIHVEDVARAILFAIEHHNIEGAINLTAPHPKKMTDFGRTIAKVLHKPHWLPAPSLLMKIALGKKSDLVLKGQQVYPNVLLENGFTFTYPTLDVALKNIFKK